MTPRPGFRARARRGRTNRVVVSAARPSRSLRRRGECPLARSAARRCVNFRVWAPDHGAVDVVIGEASWPLDDEGTAFLRQRQRDRTRHAVPLPPRRTPGVIPGPRVALSAIWPAPAPVRSHMPRHLSMAHPRRGAQRRGQVIYEMHIGTYTLSRHSPRGSRQARTLGAFGRHRHRTDAAQRISRTIQLGLRRGQPFCALSGVRPAGRPACVRGCRARKRTRRKSWTLSTTISARTGVLFSACSPRIIFRATHRPNGATALISMARIPPASASSSPKRRLLDP